MDGTKLDIEDRELQEGYILQVWDGTQLVPRQHFSEVAPALEEYSRQRAVMPNCRVQLVVVAIIADYDPSYG